MKYLIVLIIGMLTGVAVFAAGTAYNPFIGNQGLSPLAVTDLQTVTLAYSGVASALGSIYPADVCVREGVAGRAWPGRRSGNQNVVTVRSDPLIRR